MIDPPVEGAAAVPYDGERDMQANIRREGGIER